MATALQLVIFRQTAEELDDAGCERLQQIVKRK
jgi:hypothetical protein